MIRILTLAAILVIGSAVEKTKTPVKLKAAGKDTNSEPSSLQSAVEDAFAESTGNQVWDSRRGPEDNLDLSEKENRIVQDFYSPDYYEPNIILDYRYMKSGGRGYARSDGGQILILPKRNHMPTLYNNYDTLIEYLRLKNLEEIESKWGKILKNEHEEKGHHRRGPDMHYESLNDGLNRQGGQDKRPYRTNAGKIWI